MAEPQEVLAKELQQQLFVPMEMANQASVGGMALLTCLMLLGLLGMAWLSAGRRKKAGSVHSDHSHSFHAGSRHMRSTSPSLVSALSMGNSSHISSISQHHHMSNGPKSLPLSIISVMSRSTMTSKNQSTMTDGITFDLEEEIKRLQDIYSRSRIGSIVNTADIVIIPERHIERKDSSNMESYDVIRDSRFSLCKKSSVDSETNTPWRGVENAGFEDEVDGVADATRRMSDFVNNNCSGRRRKFEPKYATISNI